MLLLLTFHMKQAEERGVSRLRRDTTQVKSLGRKNRPMGGTGILGNKNEIPKGI